MLRFTATLKSLQDLEVKLTAQIVPCHHSRNKNVVSVSFGHCGATSSFILTCSLVFIIGACIVSAGCGLRHFLTLGKDVVLPEATAMSNLR